MPTENCHPSTDVGITGGLKTVSYVADSRGHQELVSASIWQPVDIVNRQAWQVIENQINASKEKIAAGRASCLHYYMTANQMDIHLLAQYTRQTRWLVRLHLIPALFNRLGAATINKYAHFFKVSPDDLIQGRLKPPIYHQSEYEDPSVG